MRTPSYTKAATAATLNICHCVTADMDDGQALPPFIDDNVVWHVVRRADGRTMWRSISLSACGPSAAAAEFMTRALKGDDNG